MFGSSRVPSMLIVEFRHMAILAECDICGSQHRVKDALIGHCFRCKDCGVQIVVPDGALITPQTFIEDGGRLRRREPVQNQSIWPWIVSSLVACLVFGALIIILWTLISI